MQQSQTAHLPTIATDSSVVVQAVLAMARLAFSLSASSAFSHISAVHNASSRCPVIPMHFPVTDDRCRFSDLLCFPPRLPG